MLSLQAASGSTPGSPHGWIYPENLQSEACRRHLNQIHEPRQLAPFDTKEQQVYSGVLSDVRAPQPPKSLKNSHSSEQSLFNHIFSPSALILSHVEVAAEQQIS